jgi:hypothetical protein
MMLAKKEKEGESRALHTSKKDPEKGLDPALSPENPL